MLNLMNFFLSQVRILNFAFLPKIFIKFICKKIVYIILNLHLKYKKKFYKIQLSVFLFL